MNKRLFIDHTIVYAKVCVEFAAETTYSHSIMVKFYSYWYGNIPPVTELFFASFLATQKGEMHIFIDNCRDIGPLDLGYLQNPRIIIHKMNWKALNPDPVFDGFIQNLYANRIDRLLFRMYRKLNPGAFEIHPQQGMKFTSKIQKLLFLIRFKQPYPITFYADLFRCIQCVANPEDLVYVDMDICFLKDFEPLFSQGDFIYKWENQSYGNNAIIYSSKSGVLKRNIKNLIKKHDTVLPWYIFSYSEPLLGDLRVLPCELFDPLWANDKGISFNDFFKDFDLIDMIDSSYCHHWHNNWGAIPTENSTYMYYLNKYKKFLANV